MLLHKHSLACLAAGGLRYTERHKLQLRKTVLDCSACFTTFPVGQVDGGLNWMKTIVWQTLYVRSLSNAFC